MCLKYVKMNVNLPMVALIDNIGAIEMLDSKTGKCRTKHVNTCYHWIKEYVDNDTVKVAYVKLENNVADILTKNLQPRLFEKHASKLVTNIENASEPVNDVGFFVRCDKTKFPQKKPLRLRSRFNRNVGCKIWPGYIMQHKVWLPDEDDPNREKYTKVWYS